MFRATESMPTPTSNAEGRATKSPALYKIDLIATALAWSRVQSTRLGTCRRVTCWRTWVGNRGKWNALISNLFAVSQDWSGATSISGISAAPNFFWIFEIKFGALSWWSISLSAPGGDCFTSGKEERICSKLKIIDYGHEDQNIGWRFLKEILTSMNHECLSRLYFVSFFVLALCFHGYAHHEVKDLKLFRAEKRYKRAWDKSYDRNWWIWL